MASADPPAAAPGPRPGVPAWLGLLVPLAAFGGHVTLYARHVNDDAFITFRYSRFLASGLGPYFNPGEHVEGYTNLLQMLLMALVFAVGGESAVPLAAKALGVLAGAGTLALTFSITRRLVERGAGNHGNVAGATAATLVAVFPGFALNATSGLETAPYAFLVALALHLSLRSAELERWRGSGAAWAAAALSRPEGAAVFAVSWICDVGRHVLDRDTRMPRVPRRAWLDAVVVLAAVGGQLAFRVAAYDGELLPNTYHAKAFGFWGTTPWEYVREGALAAVLGVLGLALGLVGWWRPGRPLRPGWPVLGVGLAGAALPFLVGTDWMPGWRFAVPYLAPLAIGVVTGWFRLFARVLARPRWFGPALAAAVALLAAALHHAERRELADLVELRADAYASGHRSLAAWITEGAARPGDTVALMDIGIVGYYCPEQRILDITGLTDRHIAKSPGRLLKKRYDPRYVLDQRPELLVLVFHAPGDPRGPLPSLDAVAASGTWTEIELEMLAHPVFQAEYRRAGFAEPGRFATDLEALAAGLGAERVFRHGVPGEHYLLAVYRHRPVE